MLQNATSLGSARSTDCNSDSSDADSTRVPTSEADGATITSRSPSYICKPTSPSLTSRYRLNRTVEDATPEYKIQPFSTSLPHKWSVPDNRRLDPHRTSETGETLPSGWQRCVHPEGLPYFFLPPSLDCPMRIVTEEWLYDYRISILIHGAIQTVRDKISQTCRLQVITWPDNDLFVDLQRDQKGELVRDKDGKIICGYYLVTHSKRRICWAEEVTLVYDLSLLLHNVRGKISGYQAETCLEAEYWTHWSNFPNIQKKTPDIYNHVVQSIVDAMTDLVSSDTSALGYTYEQLQKRLEIVKAARGCTSSSWHIGRFMKEITSERLRNYYDTWCARLSREQVVFEVPDTEELSKLLQMMSLLLFLIPHAQLLRVKTLIVDQTVVMIQWHNLFDQLQDEWNNTVLIATIILAANCAFLAIPIFQREELLKTHSSPEQIMSYLSLTASLFGLVLGMVMYRHHKTRKPRDPDELESYIYGQNTQSGRGFTRMQHLFLVWSLPQALVMWSAISFSVAFLIMCFLGTLTVTKIVIGCSALFLGIFTFYYVVRFGSGRELLQCWLAGFGQIGRNLRDSKLQNIV